MKKEESHFGEDVNMFCIGAFIGIIVAACFIINYYNGSNKTQGKIIQAYERSPKPPKGNRITDGTLFYTECKR